MSEPIELTVFTKSGGPLTKRISLTPDGKIASDGNACTMARGRAKRVRIDRLGELAALIEGLTSNQAIALGALARRSARRGRASSPSARSCRRRRQGHRRPDGRELRLPARPARAGAVRLRHQGHAGRGGAATRHRGGFWAALVSVLPVSATVGYLLRLSTSAGLCRTDTGEKFPGSGGLHGYVTIKDGADAVRFLKTLHARCWLAGFGWMMVGAAGQLLERSIIDRMVGAAERLVFEGPPVVEPPLRQDAAARRPVVAGDVLDSVAACPPLSIVEQQAFDRLQAQAKRAPGARNARPSAPHGSPARKAELVARTGMTRGGGGGRAGEAGGRPAARPASSCHSTTPSWPARPSPTCSTTRRASRARRWPTRLRASRTDAARPR